MAQPSSNFRRTGLAHWVGPILPPLVESKFSKPPFHSVDNRLSESLDLIHTDICDMKSIPSRGGNKYFITFIDDCSRYCYVYLLSSKDEVVNAFKTYKAEVET